MVVKGLFFSFSLSLSLSLFRDDEDDDSVSKDDVLKRTLSLSRSGEKNEKKTKHFFFCFLVF